MLNTSLTKPRKANTFAMEPFLQKNIIVISLITCEKAFKTYAGKGCPQMYDSNS